MTHPSYAENRSDSFHKALIRIGISDPSPELIDTMTELTHIAALLENPDLPDNGVDFWTQVLPHMIQQDPADELPQRLRNYIHKREMELDASDEDYF